MKIPVSHPLIKCAAFVIAFGCWAVARAENTTNAPSKVGPPALIKSVFVTDSSSGKDPFYPNSTRQQQVIVHVTLTNSAPQPNALFRDLSLKGISGSKGKMLALINSSTVGEGELAEIRVGQKFVKIRCREIHENSVIIALDGTGETRELKLRSELAFKLNQPTTD